MAKKTEQVVEKTEKTEKIEIIRGRMPAAIVYLIKFAAEDMSVATLAAKFRTTVGKVSDIKASRNFAYIDETYAMSESDLEAARAYADQLGEPVVSELESIKIGSPEAIFDYEAARTASRTRKPNSEAEEVSDEEVSDGDLLELTD